MQQLPTRFPHEGCLATLWSDLQAGHLEGIASELLPGALLFCLTRAGATGRLTFEGETGLCSVGFRAGRVHELEGGKGIFDGLQAPGAPARSLSEGMALAFQSGLPADRVMSMAMDGVGRVLAERCCDLSGRVCFDASQVPPRGSFALQHDAIRLLDAGLRQAGSIAVMEQALKTQGRESLQVHVLFDLPEANWGLDAISLRIVHLSPSCGDFEDLVLLVTGDQPRRRGEVMHRIYVLLSTGLLFFGPPVADVRLRTAAKKKPEPEPRPEVERPKLPDATLKKLQEMSHLARLELAHGVKKPNIDEIGMAFRGVSRRYHPDRLVGATAEERQVASACFTCITESYRALQNPEVLELEWRKVECQRAGVPFVTAEDATRARVALKKAEHLIRNREYEIAESCLGEAMRLDPATLDYVRLHAYIAFLAKQLSGKEALARLDAIVPNDAAMGSSIQVTAANILRLCHAPSEKVLERFKKALKLDPSNRDAERGVRMLAAQVVQAETTADPPSFLSRFFGRKGPGPV
jgi:hypothetical protein